jgi:hypothetical protein
MIGVIFGSTLVGILLWIFLTIFYEIFRSRKDMLPEKYPFQSTCELTANIDRINDYFVELVEKVHKRSFALKIFVRLFLALVLMIIFRDVIGGFIQMTSKSSLTCSRISIFTVLSSLASLLMGFKERDKLSNFTLGSSWAKEFLPLVCVIRLNYPLLLTPPIIDGESWHKHRKTSSQLFNLNVFKNGVLDTCPSPLSHS